MTNFQLNRLPPIITNATAHPITPRSTWSRVVQSVTRYIRSFRCFDLRLPILALTPCRPESSFQFYLLLLRNSLSIFLRATLPSPASSSPAIFTPLFCERLSAFHSFPYNILQLDCLTQHCPILIHQRRLPFCLGNLICSEHFLCVPLSSG